MSHRQFTEVKYHRMMCTCVVAATNSWSDIMFEREHLTLSQLIMNQNAHFSKLLMQDYHFRCKTIHPQRVTPYYDQISIGFKTNGERLDIKLNHLKKNQPT